MIGVTFAPQKNILQGYTRYFVVGGVLNKSPRISVENELMQALRAGDPTAYRQVYRDCYPSVSQFIRLHQGTEEDAQDIFQNALILLLEKIQDDTFQITCKLKTYLYSVCRYQWLNHLRKVASVNEMAVQDHEAFIQINAVEDDVTPPADIEEVIAHIKNLGKECEEILLSFYYQQLSYKEIGQNLGMSESVVKQRRYRCMDRLKKMLRL